MGRWLGLSIAALITALAVVVGVPNSEGGSALATTGKNASCVGQERQASCATQQARRRRGRARRRHFVVCRLGAKRRVICPKRRIRGVRGRRGPPGPAGPEGPEGPEGPKGDSGAGSGLTLNFNANLNANETKQVVVGNFTVRAAAGATGNCVNIQLRAGDVDSRVAKGSGGKFSFLPNNLSTDLQSGDTSQMFTAITDNGKSTASGIVGRVTVGGRCLVSGYVTGV